MMGKAKRDKDKLFYYGFNIGKRVRADNPLRLINKVIDFEFVYKEVSNKYGRNGNVSVPPPVILKMMFLLFFYNVRSERELMRTIPERLDWLWFLGYGIDDEIPHHSVLSKARKRWGEGLFRKFFTKIVEQCVEAGLINGDKIFIDSTLIDADASNKSVMDKKTVERYANINKMYKELEKKLDEKGGKYISKTDPDADITKHGNGKARVRYKEHRGIDKKFGVITASEVTSGNIDDGQMLFNIVDTHQENTGIKVDTAVGDSKYGTEGNYLECKDRGITPHLKDLKSTQDKVRERRGIFSEGEFKYDREADTFICPAGKRLKKRTYHKNRGKWEYAGLKEECVKCSLREKCTKSKSGVRTIWRHERQEELDKMREEARSYMAKQDLKKRQEIMERSFADGANLHGLKRARWRGQWRMAIQVYMISAIQNIRILINHTYLRTNSGVMINKEPSNNDVEKVIMANFILGLYILKIWAELNKNMTKIERKKRDYPENCKIQVKKSFGQHALNA
jgi:transposase